jgi:hypothetical protein
MKKITLKGKEIPSPKFKPGDVVIHINDDEGSIIAEIIVARFVSMEREGKECGRWTYECYPHCIFRGDEIELYTNKD